MSLSMFEEKMPNQVTEEVGQFCEEVAPGQKPIYVPVQPTVEAELDQCHLNVEEHVKSNGGTPVYGWIVWQSPALLHALFHCNWLSPDGELVDITPKADGERKVLFLPDPTNQWTGRSLPCRRKARRSNTPLLQWVKVHEQMDTIRVSYLPGQRFSPFDEFRFLDLMLQAGKLELAISGSWSANPEEQIRTVDRRSSRKADRQRRKQQRRRK